MKTSIITTSLLGTLIQQSTANCQIGDVMYSEGDSTGYIGFECINSTSFDAEASTCGPDGRIIDEEIEMTCPDSVPYCMQCGDRGYGAALCLSTPDLGNRPCEEPDELGLVINPETDTVCGVGAACSEGSTCNDGQTETCCGKTHNSFECECYNGEYMCMYTDACMMPMCDTDVGDDGIGDGDDVLIDDWSTPDNVVDPTVEPDVPIETTSAPTSPANDATTTIQPVGGGETTVISVDPTTTTTTDATAPADNADPTTTTATDATAPVDNSGDTSGDPDSVTEVDDSSANGLCAFPMAAVSVLISIGVSMMLA